MGLGGRRGKGRGNSAWLDAHKKAAPKGSGGNQNTEAVLGIGGLEHFLHHGQVGWHRLQAQSPRTASMSISNWRAISVTPLSMTQLSPRTDRR